MLFHPYDNQSGLDKGGATHVAEVTYKDITASTDTGNTKTVALFTIPANTGAELVHMEMPEVFVSSDGTLISTAITVGDGGSANRHLTSTELNQAGTEVFLKGGVTATPPYVPTADTATNCYFTATATKALNTHTQGKLRLFFRLTDYRTNAGQGLPFDITTKAAQ